jgi:hypothetical protein
MVSFAHRNKVDTTPDKQDVAPRHDNGTAALPERLSLGRLFGRERPTESADKGSPSVTKALGLTEHATNQDVINALYKRYDRDYSAMYKGAQRDFGIDIGTLVQSKHERFVANETAQQRGEARSSGTAPDTTRETPLQKFLQTNKLDESSTNRELINALYARYGVNDATTYARARRELGVDIDKLVANRDGRIDGKDVVVSRTPERTAPDKASSPRDTHHERQTEEKHTKVSPSPATRVHSPAQPTVPTESPLKHERTPSPSVSPSAKLVADVVRHYPKSPLDETKADDGYTGPYLRDQFAIPNYIDNSCAIRLHYALHKSGIAIDTKGAAIEKVHPTTETGKAEAPFAATLRARELFAKIGQHFEGAEKSVLAFGPHNKPDLAGVTGFVLYEYQDRATGAQIRHIGIIDNGKEQTLHDPITLNKSGKATLLVMDRQDSLVVMR